MSHRTKGLAFAYKQAADRMSLFYTRVPAAECATLEKVTAATKSKCPDVPWSLRGPRIVVDCTSRIAVADRNRGGLQHDANGYANLPTSTQLQIDSDSRSGGGPTGHLAA